MSTERNAPPEPSDPQRPAGAAKADQPASAPAAASAKKPRRWRRRLVRLGVVLVVLALLFRVALSVLLPTVLSKTARRFGFDLDYRRINLNVLGTEAGIWGLELRPIDKPDQVVYVDYAAANLATLKLFTLKLVVYRVEGDGVTVNVVRKPDGSIPLLDQVHAALGPATPKPPAPPAPPAPFSFDPPIVVEAVRLNHVKLNVRDESASPPFVDSLTLALRASDFGHPTLPMTFELDVYTDSVLRAFRAKGEWDFRGTDAEAQVTFAAYGLDAARARVYLEPLGVRVRDNEPLEATGSAKVYVTNAPTPGAIAATASVTNFRLSTPTQEWLALKSGSVDVAEASPSSLHVKLISADGGHLRAERGRDGLLRFASFEAGSPPEPGRRPAATEAASPAATRSAGATTGITTGITTGATPAATAPFAWRLDQLTATSLVAHVSDRAVDPANALSAVVKSFTVGTVTSDAKPTDVVEVRSELAVAGLAGGVTLTASATPYAPDLSLNAKVAARGVKPDALRPYLAPFGVEPTLESGDFTAELAATISGLPTGTPSISAKVSGVKLTDGPQRLLELSELNIAGLRVDTVANTIDLAELKATGPTMAVRRLDAHTIEVPGFRVGQAKVSATPTPAASAAAPATSPGTAVAAATSSALPVLRVGKLTWGGANIRLEDLLTPDSKPIDLADAAFELMGFVFDLRPDAPPSPPGRITGRFRSDGFVRSLKLDGTLTPRAGQLQASMVFDGNGIQLARLEPYLRPLRIEPRLADGAVAGKVDVAVRQPNAGSLEASVDVRDLKLADGATPLLSLGRLSVDRAAIGDGMAVGNVLVEKPYALVERDADGGLIAGGVKLVPQPAVPTAVRAAPGEPAAVPPADPFAVLAALPPASLDALRVTGAAVEWRDRAAPSGPVDIRLTVDGTLTQLAVGGPQPRLAQFEFSMSSPRLADRITARGNLAVRRDAVSLNATVDGAGMTAAAATSYLPANLKPTLVGGTFKTSASVQLSRHPQGGVRGSVAVDGFDYRDANAATPFLALRELQLNVDRVNLATGDVVVTRLGVSGVELDAARLADGSLAALGFTLSPAVPGAAAAQPAPLIQQPAAEPADAAVSDVSALVAQGQRALPLLSLDTLDVRVGRIAFEDKLRAAAPVVLRDVTVGNGGPIRLLGPKPDANPPIDLRVGGGLEPLVGRFDVDVIANAFAERPTLKISVDAGGISGDGLIRAVPELAAFIDGQPLTDGRFHTKLEAEAAVRRRGPTQIDFSRGLELTFSVSDTRLTNGDNGPVLAGVGSVRGEQIKLEPATGNVTVRALEINDLVANAWREPDGIHVLGLRVKHTGVAPPTEPASSTQRSEEVATAAPATAPSAVAATSAAGQPADPAAKPEIRLDRLSISGLNFTLEDRVLQPAVTIPVTSLDAEVRGVSSLMFERDRPPVRFTLAMTSGKVALAKKVRGGKLTGAIGDLARVGAPATREYEQRDFFSQIVASGDLRMYPKPQGRAIASISGVELGAVGGIASAVAIGLSGGTFDGRVELKTRDDGVIDARSRFVLTDLQLQDSPDGAVVRYLSLPAPLDAVIGAVEAADGSITLPLNFEVKDGRPEGIVPAAVGALSGVLATAVASAPVKIVGGVLGMFVDLSPEMQVVQDPPATFEYGTGMVSLSDADRAAVAALLARLKADKTMRVEILHELGPADVEISDRRVNLPPADGLRLAEQLRGRRGELLARRAELLSAARADALGAAKPGGALTELRAVQAELARVEDALDRLYDLQRPSAGTEAAKSRRTRSAALDLASGRLNEVRTMIQSLNDPSAIERVRLGTARFEPRTDGSTSRLVINVARAVKKPS